MDNIQKIEDYLNENPEICKALGCFRNKFTLVEMRYKELLKTYFDSKHTTYNEENLKLHTKQIKAVLKFHKIQKKFSPLLLHVKNNGDCFAKRNH